MAGTIWVHAQGYIEFVGPAAGITTNTSYIGGSVSGLISSGKFGANVAPFAYDFQLLYWVGPGAPTDGITDTANWQTVDLYDSTTPLFGTNFDGPGTFAGQGGGSGVGTALNPGQTYYVDLVGWSADLGNSWSVVEPIVADPLYNDGGFFGETTVGTLTPTASTTGQPNMFPTTWFNGSMVLNSLAIPEPTTLALASLGGLSMLFLRRRKS